MNPGMDTVHSFDHPVEDVESAVEMPDAYLQLLIDGGILADRVVATLHLP
jgi:hypothetical protein